jgi:hypothetical protein
MGEQMNKGKRFITEGDSAFGKEYFKKEQARAIQSLINADNFILIAHNKNGGGDTISCVNGDQLFCMLAQLKQITLALFDTAGKVNEHILDEKITEIIKDIIKKGVKDDKDNG